jgi:hypothetical protein
MIKPLSMEEHIKIANNLHKMKELLFEIIPTEPSRGKFFSCKESDKLIKINNMIGSVRSYFEDRMFREHPGTASTKVYYGKD